MGGSSSTVKPKVPPFSGPSPVPISTDGGLGSVLFNEFKRFTALEAAVPPPPTKKPTPKPKPKPRAAALEADAVDLANKRPPILRRSSTFIATATDNEVDAQRQLHAEGKDLFVRRPLRELKTEDEQEQLKSEGDDAFFWRFPRDLETEDAQHQLNAEGEELFVRRPLRALAASNDDARNASADVMSQSQALFGGAVLLCAAIALLVVKRVKSSKTPARGAEPAQDAYVRM